MANLRGVVYSLYINDNRLLCFERKSLCMVLVNHSKQFLEKVFDTSINVSFEIYGVK